MPQASPANRNSIRSMPAPPTKVKEYILKILSSGQPMKRDEVVSRARALAPVDGFVLTAGNAIPTVKKALALLFDEGRIERPRIGWWRITRIPDCTPVDEQSSTLGESEVEPEPETRVHIEREIGSGPESVYVYYHDAYAELARRKGSPVWECKVGSTFGPPDARVIGQGALTQFPRTPIIGLVIRTENGRGLERALHIALTLAEKRIEGGGGSEWFVTSPDQIERWVCAYWNSLTIFASVHKTAIEAAETVTVSKPMTTKHLEQ